MRNEELKSRIVSRVLPRVQTPGQYVGGELNAVVKQPGRVRGRLCLAFPDTYAIGMSHHGLHVLYGLMNALEDWWCERAFAPWPDMERLLREQGLPLYSLESFTPLAEFDIVGFTLQHDLCYTNVLNMLDLGGIPIRGEDRGEDAPLIVAGGPCVQNPEPMARFVDLFVVGDGEEALPEVCRRWIELKRSGAARREALAELASRLPYAYVPRAYAAHPDPTSRVLLPCPALPGVPEVIRPATVADLDAVPLPAAPVVPNVECVQDRITIEIMRGCPWRCRFCQSTTIKRPLRLRSVETIVRSALEAYRKTGYNEVSLLSLSTSDYPRFDELVKRLREVFQPLNVSVSVPSLRVNRKWRELGDILTTERRGGLTLAPEAAREEMRQRIGKRITDEDLMEGCRRAFAAGFNRVKLYFMCGLPGEEEADLDGIVELSERISRLGREESGRMATVVANVANFVPKPQTPFQWNAMQTREYFEAAHRRLRGRVRLRSVKVKYHDLETSLLEGMLCRGDRRMGEVIERAWRGGARMDGWSDQFNADLWRRAIADSRIDVAAILHTARPIDARFPWDHIAVRQGRDYLVRERELSEADPSRTTCGMQE